MPKSADISIGYNTLKNNFETDAEDFNARGENYDFIKDALMKIMSGNDPAFNKILQSQTNQLGRVTDRRLRNADEDLSARGLSRAGIGSAVRNDIYANESNAMEGILANNASMQLGRSDNALGRLMGLDQQTTGREMQFLFGKNDFLRGLMSNWNNDLFQHEGLKLQRDQGDRAFWGDIIGGLIGAGGSVGAAALSDLRVKENVDYTGEVLAGGIPVCEFSYIGGSKRYRGVIAQDVEGVIPSAVIERNGIKYVDYDKLSINMTEV